MILPQGGFYLADDSLAGDLMEGNAVGGFLFDMEIGEGRRLRPFEEIF